MVAFPGRSRDRGLPNAGAVPKRSGIHCGRLASTSHGVILDYDATGNIVSIEVLDASRRVEEPRKVTVETEGSAGLVSGDASIAVTVPQFIQCSARCVRLCFPSFAAPGAPHACGYVALSELRCCRSNCRSPYELRWPASMKSRGGSRLPEPVPDCTMCGGKLQPRWQARRRSEPPRLRT